jgi:SAM-dependent methyltransferase
MAEKDISMAEAEGGASSATAAIDGRLEDILKLLEYAPDGIGSILDVGLGGGGISEYFSRKGVKTTAIGLALESYSIDLQALRERGIEIVEANVESMPFPDSSFDAVIASHIFEHVENSGAALREMRRVLKNGGWLLLFLPAFTEYVCSGHINTGWNIGQLMYVLLLNRFNVKEGRFIKYGYSLCAYVKKDDSIALPPLRHDYGDIDALDRHGLWPLPIEPGPDGIRNGFWGDMLSVNWENAEALILPRLPEESAAGKLFDRAVALCETLFGSDFCGKIGWKFSNRHVLEETKAKINPKTLRHY